MNKLYELDKREKELLEEAGYIIEDREYSAEDYEKCANFICDYIMNHSKNEIPKIENKYSSILRKIV